MFLMLYKIKYGVEIEQVTQRKEIESKYSIKMKCDHVIPEPSDEIEVWSRVS